MVDPVCVFVCVCAFICVSTCWLIYLFETYLILLYVFSCVLLNGKSSISQPMDFVSREFFGFYAIARLYWILAMAGSPSREIMQNGSHWRHACLFLAILRWNFITQLVGSANARAHSSTLECLEWFDDYQLRQDQTSTPNPADHCGSPSENITYHGNGQHQLIQWGFFSKSGLVAGFLN